MTSISVRAVDPSAPTSAELESARQELLNTRDEVRANRADTPSGPEGEYRTGLTQRPVTGHDVAPPLRPPEIHQGQILSRIA